MKRPRNSNSQPQKRGDARPCVATEFLQDLNESDPEYEDKRKLIHDVLAAVYAGTPPACCLYILVLTNGVLLAGSDTTVSTVTTFLLAMAQNPAIQKRAQAAVDEAVKGEGGLPDFTHYQKLPYVDAIVREVLRWKPVAPVGKHFSLPPLYRASKTPLDQG